MSEVEETPAAVEEPKQEEEAAAVEPVPEPEPVVEPEPAAEPEPAPAADEGKPEPEPVAAEPVKEPTPEPVKEPTPEPVKEPTPEPVKEPTPEPVVKEPTPEPEEEVVAADLYKNKPHTASPEGAPFDPTAPGCDPVDDENDCKLLDTFVKSSTLWICYEAASSKDNYLTFNSMGDSVKTLKAAFDPKKQMFFILKAKAQDVKNNVVSERLRLVRMTLLGSRVPVMKRRFKTDAWTYFNAATTGIQKDMQFDETEECDWLSWAKELKKNGGAHQPTQYMFGPDEVWQC